MTNKQIHRGNYEEFFLLYVDNELSAADKKAVEAFVSAHPDLRDELDLLLDTRLTPEEHPFANPEVLMKPAVTARRHPYVLLRWMAPVAAAAWLLFMGIRHFGGAVDGPPVQPPIEISRQEPVPIPAEPRTIYAPAPVQQIPEKHPIAVPVVSRPKTTAPLAVTEVPKTAEAENETTQTVTEKVVTELAPEETIRNKTLQQISVKNNYATEALFYSDEETEIEDEPVRQKKGFRVLLRKATRIYQKVVEPEGDKPLIRLTKN